MASLNKLRWRCRRGMRELDLMLIRYLECRYLDADSSERHAFLHLLELRDDELMRYLMDGQQPDDPRLRQVLPKIRAYR